MPLKDTPGMAMRRNKVVVEFDYHDYADIGPESIEADVRYLFESFLADEDGDEITALRVTPTEDYILS